MKMITILIVFCFCFSSCEKGDREVTFQYQLIDFISNLPVPDYELYLKIKDSEIEMKFRTDQDGIFEITQSSDEVFYDLHQFFEIKQEISEYIFSRGVIKLNKFETPYKIIVYPKIWLGFSFEQNQDYDFYNIEAFEIAKEYPYQLFFLYPQGTWMIGDPLQLSYYNGGYTPAVKSVELRTTFIEKITGNKMIVKDTVEFKSLDTTYINITIP